MPWGFKPSLEKVLAAIEKDDEAAVSKYMRTGFNTKRYHYDTILCAAARRQNLEMVKVIIGDDDIITNNPLTTAIRSTEPDPQLVQFLMDRTADLGPDLWDSRGPIHSAIEYNHFEIVKTLFDRGANPFRPIRYVFQPDTTLILAIESYYSIPDSNLRIIEYLLEVVKLPINEKGRHGMSPLHYALTLEESYSRSNNNESLIKLLIHHNADVNDVLLNDYFRVANWSAMEVATRPLHVAVSCGRQDLAEMLLKSGANPNGRANLGRTALHFAVQKTLPCVSLVGLLLDHGADVNFPDDEGITPLLMILQDTNVREIDVITLLLKRGADPNAKSARGETPMQLAERYKNAELIELLSTPLHSLKSLSFNEGRRQEDDAKVKDVKLENTDPNGTQAASNRDGPESKKVNEWQKQRALKRKSEQKRRNNFELTGKFDQPTWHGATQAVSITSNPAAEWLRDTQRLQCILHGDTSDEDRVRIAIIDSGIHPAHLQLALVREYKDFITQNDDIMVDETRHGSTGVDIISEISPDADIYVARVFKGSEAKADTPELISQAIQHAVSVWKADIISLASGLHSPHEGVRKAVQTASANGTIIFAAASNYGSIKGITFPARMYPDNTLMCMFASSGMGKAKNEFNPATMREHHNFALLGENVPVYSHLKEKFKSGTSYATFTGASVAALLLDFSRQSDIRAKKKRVRQLCSVAGMTAVFNLMAEGGRDDKYDCVVPSKLLGDSDISAREESRTEIWSRISVALEKIDRGY